MFQNLYYGWRIVAACFLINLYVGGITFFGFTAFFEPIQREFHWSYTQVSLATSLRGLEMGIFAPVVGFLVDRFGSRRLLLGGAVIIGAGMILLSLIQSLPMFYLCILFIAFGSGGCASVVTMTAVAIWFRKRIGLALGLTACGFGAGGLIIPLIVYLIDAAGWRSTLVFLGVGMWILGIPLAFVIRERSAEWGSGADPADSEPDATALRNAGPEREEADFLTIIRQRSFMYLVIAETVRLMAVNAVITHLMPCLSLSGISRSAAGAVATALPVVSIAGRVGFGWLGDRIDKRAAWAITFFCMGAGVLAFCHVRSLWALLLFILLFAPGFGGGMVLRGAILQRFFGMGSFGKMLGVLLGFGSVGGIIGPTLAGWVFDNWGSYLPVWYMLSAASMAAILLIARIRPVASTRDEG